CVSQALPNSTPHSLVSTKTEKVILFDSPTTPWYHENPGECNSQLRRSFHSADDLHQAPVRHLVFVLVAETKRSSRNSAPQFGDLAIELGQGSFQHLAVLGMGSGVQLRLDILAGKQKAVSLATAFNLLRSHLGSRSVFSFSL